MLLLDGERRRKKGESKAHTKLRYETAGKIILPESLQSIFIERYHNEGHYGAVKTYLRMRQKYAWDTMYADIKAWVMNCETCGLYANRPPKVRQEGHLNATEIGETIVMDVLHMPESDSGHSYLLVMVDTVSKWAMAAPLKKLDSESVAQALIDELGKLGGRFQPKNFVSDGGPELIISSNRIMMDLG